MMSRKTLSLDADASPKGAMRRRAMLQMRRRALIAAAGTLLIAPLSIVAQQPPRVRLIGVITTRARPLSLETDYLGAWIPRLREFGYLEGRDFSVEWRFADGNNDHCRAWRPNWCDSSPISSWLREHLRPARCRKRPRQFRLLSLVWPIQSDSGSWRACHGRAETSRAHRSWRRMSVSRAWSICSLSFPI